MGLFGFGKKSISNKEIDNIVMAHLQKLGSPIGIVQKENEQKFIEMLNELDKWATSLRFGDLKRSAIAGSIESILRANYKKQGVDDIISAYIKMTQKIILKIDWS